MQTSIAVMRVQVCIKLRTLQWLWMSQSDFRTETIRFTIALSHLDFQMEFKNKTKTKNIIFWMFMILRLHLHPTS